MCYAIISILFYSYLWIKGNHNRETRDTFGFVVGSCGTSSTAFCAHQICKHLSALTSGWHSAMFYETHCSMLCSWNRWRKRFVIVILIILRRTWNNVSKVKIEFVLFGLETINEELRLLQDNCCLLLLHSHIFTTQHYLSIGVLIAIMKHKITINKSDHLKRHEFLVYH